MRLEKVVGATKLGVEYYDEIDDLATIYAGDAELPDNAIVDYFYISGKELKVLHQIIGEIIEKCRIN